MAAHDGAGSVHVPGPSRRLALFGDPLGLPQSLLVCQDAEVVALVGASIRPAQHTDIAALAGRVGIPFLVQPGRSDGSYGSFVERLSRLAPDLILVNSYSMILGEDVLAVPRHGAVNVHGAMLPAYRGANPTEWALINGERSTGVTIHMMDAGIDTGPIVAQRSVPIQFEDTWLDVRRRVQVATETLLVETIPAILAGKARAIAQEGGGRHWPRRRPDDGDFSWAMPAVDIYNLVRALVAPHAGASAEGKAIASWQSLPSIVWRKFAAGAGALWSRGRWRLVPHRPLRSRDRRRANAALALDLRSAGAAVATCSIKGFSDPSGPLLAVLLGTPRCRLLRTHRSELESLICRFSESELKREVVFG
jgi:methionyl-tRNA formyltransferase